MKYESNVCLSLSCKCIHVHVSGKTQTLLKLSMFWEQLVLYSPSLLTYQLVLYLISPVFILGCPCSSWTRYSCRSRKSLGGEDVLFVPRWALSLFSDGVSSWRLVTNQCFLDYQPSKIQCQHWNSPNCRLMNHVS